MMTHNLTRKIPGDVKTSVLLSATFVAGNIVVPQLCHLFHQGGPTWLPIYFFTLIAAYGFGWRTGLLTAVASPVINSVTFGMPAASILPVILVKSILLAIFASFAAKKLRAPGLFLSLTLVVVGYQLVGTCFERLTVDSWTAAFGDFIIGYPGMIAQIAGGYIILRALHRQTPSA